MRITVLAAASAFAVTIAASAEVGGPRMDKRSSLAPGLRDAGEAIWNLKLLQAEPNPPGFFEEDGLFSIPFEAFEPSEEEEDEGAEDEASDADAAEDEPATDAETDDSGGEEEEEAARPRTIRYANSDLAFSGNRVFMGNFHGFTVFETTGDSLTHILSVVCPGGQGDVSVHGDLVFMSVEQNRGRLDCGGGGTDGEMSAERFRGVRIFDVSDIENPVQIAAVQTCRGSHTHTLLPHPSDPNILYVYNQGTSGVRASEELEGCSDGDPLEDDQTARFSIDVIKVPLDAPETAAIVSRPRIFADRETGEIDGLWKGGPVEEGGQRSSATNHCHDITVYPEMGLAAGACSGNGILLDITDPETPKRIAETFDPNMAYWHSATFNNDATKILFADEWGGGLAPRCKADDPAEWGADIIVDITEDGLQNRGLYKIPTIQTKAENCVSHNGSIIPVPGRDIMVQGWYSGGISIVDFTDSDNPFEIAYFDRGPIDATRVVLGGYWAAYWHNGRIYAPEINRGLDLFQLKPSKFLSKAEIEAAERVMFEETNPQLQRRLDWPADAVTARAYLDQLRRDDAVSGRMNRKTKRELKRWSKGRPRADRLDALAAEYRAAADGASGAEAARFTALAALLDGAA
ncbi:MAG: hypothetical protein AAFR11_03120 [Pseudomonadota bacterium]